MAEHAVVEWKPILGFASYHVSNQGEVMNIRTKRILKPGILPNGYFFVILRKENAPIITMFIGLSLWRFSTIPR